MKSVAGGGFLSFTIDGVIAQSDGDEAMFKQLIEATDWAK